MEEQRRIVLGKRILSRMQRFTRIWYWGVLPSQMKKGGGVYRARNDKSKNAKEEFIGDKGSSNGWKKLREVATQQRNEVRLRGA